MSANWTKSCGLLLVLGLLAGCGKTTPATTASSDTGSSAAPASPTPIAGGLPTASIGADPFATTSLTESEPEPAEGTPEWLIREIQRIRLLPFPAMDADDEVGSSDNLAPIERAADKTAEQAKDAEERMAQVRKIRRDRNQEVVKLATGALAQTAKDPAKEAVFNTAVHHLLDAHLQLALQGDEQSIGALYEAAEAFFAKKPGTTAAAEAQLTLVNLAHANALRYAKTEPKWLQEFARHAQLFASRFPSEGDAALPMLMAAGRSCELNGLLDEAVSCFSLIEAKFPDTPQAIQAAGVLRRLKLPGQKLQLAGPTLDGNYLSVEDYPGKSVIVVFWSSHAAPFVDQIDALKAITEKYKKYAQVLSVNLDTEEGEIDAFLERTQLPWPVIFHVEQDKRSWNAPLAVHYGINTLPTIWITDPNGLVASTEVTPATLEAKLRDVILKHRAATVSKSQE
ncbi:MAG TPA: redoxin domain-containing protein [Planctomycetaceae bacterium]|nr:redoxin domain-containing protein [Planctomycetaceae bacterium]